MNDYCIILTTYSNQVIGKKIIDSLISKKLAACIQTQKITSYYHWKGEVKNDKEHLAIIKTRKKLYSKVEEDILSNHDYEVPEIIEISITGGLPSYLNWIKKTVDEFQNCQN